MIRILLIDDHSLFAEGFAILLQQADGISVTGICTDFREAIHAVETTLPDLVLLDINLGGIDGITLCRNILYQYPALPIIAVTMHHELSYVRNMKDAGAKGYLLKSAGYNQVIEAIRGVYAGDYYFGDFFEKELKRQALSLRYMPELNPKEKRILDGVIAGKTSRQIAETMEISLKTVEFYRNILFAKFNVKNVVELINITRQYS